MAMNRRGAYSALVEGKQGGGQMVALSPPISVKKPQGRGDIPFEMPSNRSILQRKKPQKPPRGVYDPSQPPDFVLHAESLDEEKGELLKTVHADTPEAKAISINYNRLIKALTELANDFILSPHWKRHELHMGYALDTTLDRTISNLNEGGYLEIPAIYALKQEVNARVCYLREHQAEIYKEKATSHLNKVMKSKTKDWGKGN